MNNDKKELAAEMRREARIAIVKIASVGIAIAIVLACYSYTKVENSLSQMMLYGIASFISALAAVFIAGAISLGREERNKKNFFLYDRRKKKEIELSALTVKDIRDKLIDFMSIFKRRGKLYIADLFDENPNIPEHFKPLFCYEILYELASDEGMDAKAFLGFGGECADVFFKYLRENEDYELANKLRSFILEHSEENNNTDSFLAYIKAKREHISEKMLGYTVKNIEKFN